MLLPVGLSHTLSSDHYTTVTPEELRGFSIEGSGGKKVKSKRQFLQ